MLEEARVIYDVATGIGQRDALAEVVGNDPRPMGSDIEYSDQVTLARALEGRRDVE